jgi:urea transporter/murein DD-endopeptidase MepM/ murein hydrolase activator NlpD
LATGLTGKSENSLDSGLLRDSVVYSYSEIFFARNKLVGILILLATMIRPAFNGGPGLLHGFLLGLTGLLCILLANGLALVLNLHRDTVREGFLGYNALLVGLAIPAMFEFTPVLPVVLVMSIVAVVFLTAALRNAFGYQFNLPVLSVPFLLVTYLTIAASPVFDTLHQNFDWIIDADQVVWMPDMIEYYLRSLGAIFFVPNVISGLLIFSAILIFSRYAILLSLLGYFISWILMTYLFNLPHSDIYHYVAFNFMLTGIAIGGIWFVPQRASLILTVASIMITGAVLAGAVALLEPFNLPVLILPFNVTMFLVLYAMRQRTKDTEPKAVDFVAGSPEANREFYKMRIARFGSKFLMRIRVPFNGSWSCTQGVDGRHTHKGPWSHAFDFEVISPDGKMHDASGEEVINYYCWKLPVLACADGLIVRVVNDVNDNKIDEINVVQNWGNLVIIEHAPGIYSKVCHLAKGSVTVHKGEHVRAGDRVGLCGNSGRSPRPHIHFQMQSTARIGAPTIYSEFHNVIVHGNDLALTSVFIPKEGQRFRAIERQNEIANMFQFPMGNSYKCEVTVNGNTHTETIEPEIDIYGSNVLKSDNGAVLHYENNRNMFTVYDFQGPKDSALFAIYCCTPKVPFEEDYKLKFSDHLSSRYFAPLWRRLLSDFTPGGYKGLKCKINYKMRRMSGALVVIGTAACCAQGKLETRAEFDDNKGPVLFSVVNNDSELVVRLRTSDE